ncbi:MAG: 2'-5' RNA ligase family protein [Caldilineaceae bacterium]
MKATFALLANMEVYNWVRKLAWEIHQIYRTGTLHVRLPPHISLKQPFAIADIAPLEVYMAELAATIPPFKLQLTELQLEIGNFQGMEYGILWLAVQETEVLRQLHNRLNQELAQRFGNTQANYDGPDYQFHMTVMMGGQPVEVYRKLYEEIAERRVDLQYSVQELAMFVYDEPMGPQGEYLTYKILPIKGRL